MEIYEDEYWVGDECWPIDQWVGDEFPDILLETNTLWT